MRETAASRQVILLCKAVLIIISSNLILLLQVSGNSVNRSCVFPFIFQSRPYSNCTLDAGGTDARPWCSTRIDGNGIHVKGMWGHCHCKEVEEETTTAAAAGCKEAAKLRSEQPVNPFGNFLPELDRSECGSIPTPGFVFGKWLWPFPF